MKILQKGKWLLALFACFWMTAAGTAYAAEKAPDGDTIAKGIVIGDMDVSGMSASEAQAAVEDYIDFLRESELKISFNGDVDGISLGELGFVWENPDVVEQALKLGNSGNVLERYKAIRSLENESIVLDIQYSWNESALRNFLQKEAQERQTEPMDAEIKRDRKAKEFIITESVTGLTVDVASTMKAAQEATDGWKGGDLTVEAVAEVVEPAFTTEMAESIQDILGEYKTAYNPGQVDRSTNLVVGCGYIDGVVLLPGDSLSFFDYLYPCTTERGYREATAYLNGRYVDSIGGGICQVSTTCYNAVLLAELEVVQRYPHSMKVSYVDPGLDSGQAWPTRNLIFANNTEYPVYVEAYASGGTLYVGLWGTETRPANRTVRYYSEYTEEYVYGEQEEYTYDPSLPYGERRVPQEEYPRITATAYKQVLIDGKVTETIVLHTDKYVPSIRKVIIGTGGLSAEEYLAGQQPPQETQAQPQPPQTQAPTTAAPTEAPTTAPTEAPTTAPTEATGSPEETTAGGSVSNSAG